MDDFKIRKNELAQKEMNFRMSIFRFDKFLNVSESEFKFTDMITHSNPKIFSSIEIFRRSQGKSTLFS